MRMSEERYERLKSTVEPPEYNKKNPKIDFYIYGEYAGSSNYYRTLKQALFWYHYKHKGIRFGALSAEFDKTIGR
jgi:hypothetical protein